MEDRRDAVAGADEAAQATLRRHRYHGFLFADLRDFTQFADEHGDQAAAYLIASYRKVVRREVRLFAGAEVRTEGDSFFVVFDSARAAIECGLAILDAAADYTRGQPDRPLRVGIGVHAGETVESDEGSIGSAVNVAARICSAADAGSLLVSDTVRALTRTSLAVSFTPLGTRRLKGLRDPLQLFRVERGTERPGALRPVARRPAALRSWAAVAAVVGIVGLVAVTIVALPFVESAASARPTASTPMATSPASRSLPPSLTRSGGSNDLEAQLLYVVPPELAGGCRHATVAEGATVGAFPAWAALICPLLGEDADTLWVDRLEAQSALGAALGKIARLAGGIPEGTCDASVPRALGDWKRGGHGVGRLACYQDGGVAWLAWTYESANIIARANRRDGDWRALFTWWKANAPFFRF